MVVSQPEVLRDGVIKKTMENFKTKIGKEYSAKDVIKVWDCISKWIENKLVQDKGILIKGIGYFTVAQWEISQGCTNTIRNPVFIVDEKLANDYNLSRNRAYNTGKICEYYLSTSSVAQDYKLNVNMVSDCFKEVVVAFRKLLYEEKDCELPFSNIGKLQIKNKTVNMKFYQEFLNKQNQMWKNRIDNEKKKHQAANYDPDWDADQYEYQKRPCSAASAISRPASSLSQYRPGTGYAGVLPNSIGEMTRPCSRLCAEPDNHARPSSRSSLHSCNEHRPTSRSSVHSRDSIRPCSAMAVISRPASALSQYRPGTGYAGVLPTSNDQTSRPCSRLCTELDDQARPLSRLSLNSCDQIRPMSRESGEFIRPVSRLSVSSRPCSRLCTNADKNTRPQSRLSLRSCEQKIRPMSRTSIRSDESVTNLLCRPESGHSIPSNKDIRPKSRTPAGQSCKQTRPTSNMSDRSTKQKMTLTRSCTSLKDIEIPPLPCPCPCPAKSVTNNNILVAESPPPDAASVRHKYSFNSKEYSNMNKNCIENKKPTLMNALYNDDQLCYSCCVRKHRLSQVDTIIPDNSVDNRNNFMKGDNPINRLNSESVLNKRKNQLKEISNYNYVTGKELLDAIKEEKNRIHTEQIFENCIFNQRPESKSKCKEKQKKLKRSLLDQIEHNKIKKETDQCSSLKKEKLMRSELIKNLHDERMKNIEAKNRSKENYLILLNKHLEDKHAIDEKVKIENKTTQIFKTILDNDFEVPAKCGAKTIKYDQRELANYQLNQQMARNLMNCEQKKKNIDFEKGLLNRIKKEEETLREKMLQKKLNLKKFMAEDLNNLLNMTETGRYKNRIPGSYPMSFPLKKMGERCRLCKKNALGCPAEKITDRPS